MKRLFCFLEVDVVKLILLTITILTLVAGSGGLCYAVPFTDIVDFSGTDTYGTRTYLELDGRGSPYEFFYSHSIDFTPPAQSISSATLTFSHKGNSANPGEAWFITDTDSFFLGTLGNSTISGDWVDQPFDLSSLLGGISGTNWTIQLRLYENTSGTDRLWIDKSVVTGEYDPVTTPDNPIPEPATMLLLGSGLIGLAGFKGRFRKK